MAIVFTLPDDVAAKHGLPAEVTYDPAVLMLDEAIDLQETLDVDAATLPERLRTKTGEPPDYKAWKIAIWLACKRAGLTAAHNDFNLNLLALIATADTSGEADDPKAAPADAPSIPEKLPGENSGESGI